MVSNALVNLREQLGETQQQFAHRMGIAVTTVARWETSRPPRGKNLAQLEQLARTSGADDLAEVFRTALQKELGSGAFEPLHKTRQNPWRLFGRDELGEAYDEFLRKANRRGHAVTAIRLEFDAEDGSTQVVDVAPPAKQTVTPGGGGKPVEKTIKLPRGPRLRIRN